MSIGSSCSLRPTPSRPGSTRKATEASSSPAPLAASKKCAAPTTLQRGMAPLSLPKNRRENPMRLAALLLAFLVAPALAAPNPVTQPSKLDPVWQAKTRAFYEKSVETPTVAGRGQMPLQSKLIADELRAAGFPEAD